jgi:hypothetical protein
MALTLAPFTSGSGWGELPRSHNLVLSRISEDGEAAGLESARVLHYQNWLSPQRRRALFAALRRCRPDRLAWLEERVAAAPPRATPLWRLLRRALREGRRWKAQRFLAGCRRIDIGHPHHDTKGALTAPGRRGAPPCPPPFDQDISSPVQRPVR